MLKVKEINSTLMPVSTKTGTWNKEIVWLCLKVGLMKKSNCHFYTLVFVMIKKRDIMWPLVSFTGTGRRILFPN